MVAFRSKESNWSNKEGFNWTLNSIFKSFNPLLKALLFSSLHLQRSPSSMYLKIGLTRSNSLIRPLTLWLLLLLLVKAESFSLK
uniref:Uncharacterized protein LOC105142034 n=1 Tax=Rhizophora mucronata TaxID=61149 RepID=A0A2P2IKP6_RHIMU